jgi:imidazolonepropionase-like amidohydrolase
MTPYEALRSATLESAQWMGMADSLGTVRVGQVADLVLLDADPTADVANLARIHAVVRAGQVFGAEALGRLRDKLYSR